MSPDLSRRLPTAEDGLAGFTAGQDSHLALKIRKNYTTFILLVNIYN